MDLKVRLQRVLQILEDAEGAAALSDLEKDIVLGELREAYTEVKFGKTENGEPEAKTPVVTIVPATPAEEDQTEEEKVVEEKVAEESIAEELVEEPVEDDEPEVEVELLFDEESKEEPEAELEPEVEQAPVSPIIPVAPVADPEPVPQPAVHSASQPAPHSVEEDVEALRPRRSAILSLYDDESKPVLGEQFHEKPSVADTIACPKGVAESAPVSSLHKAIGVADRFMLIRELFDGDAEAYDRAMDALDGQDSFDDCVIYISENFAWRSQSEATKFVMELLQRKFNE